MFCAGFPLRRIHARPRPSPHARSPRLEPLLSPLHTDHRRTNPLPAPLHPRIFPGKSEDAAAQVGGWYGDDPYGVGTGGAPSGGYAHGAMGGGAHEFGVEENRRKTIKQPGTGWAWYTCMEAMGGEIFAKTAKTPPLQSGVCGEVVTRHSSARHLRPRGHQREQREGG